MDDNSEAEMDFMIKLVIDNFDLSRILSKFIATFIATANSFQKMLFVIRSKTINILIHKSR